MNLNFKPRYFMAKCRLASSPDTAANVLKKLAQSKNGEIAKRVAENPHTPLETLASLAHHSCEQVRCAVAESATTPLYILYELAGDDHLDVRYSVAENHSTPHSVLVLLADDDNPYVSIRAQKTLSRLSKNRISTFWIQPGLDHRRASGAP